VTIACGGTGGHLFPGLAVAEALVSQGSRPSLMISAKTVDRQAVKGVQGMEVVTLPAVALQRGARWSFCTNVVRSARQSLAHFRKHRPQAVLAMGGFACVGPVLAARWLRIPVFLHESNTIPGRANRLLSHLASEVFVGFPSAASRFRREATVTGTPVRMPNAPIEDPGCRRLLGLDADRPVILVIGGSQGAIAINDIVLRALPGARSLLPHWQWLHLSGPADEARVRAAYAAEGLTAVVHGFWHRMDLAWRAASAAIGRAGASSMAEMAALRVPAVLIPFPHAADNHQFHNACAFESTGAAVLIEQADLKPEHLLAALRPMVEDAAVRRRMQSALETWDQPEAARQIAGRLLGRESARIIRTMNATRAAEPLDRGNPLVA
jgi:UDP-N-acetylglucosamine--N-acetylmuramyl-(pentapeptide) pyrophosphoryl-undecaprenol N-acetylglucosamine transferase